MVDQALEQGWFAVNEVGPGIWSIREPHHFEDVQSHLIIGDRRALLIDTGMGVGNIREVVDRLTDRPVTLVNSHAHFDHVGGNRDFIDGDIAIHVNGVHDLAVGVSRERMAYWFDAKYLVGLPDGESASPITSLPAGFDPGNAAIPGTRASIILYGGETLDLGGRVLEAIHSPGHDAALVVFLLREERILFSTDAAYPAPLYAMTATSNLADYVQTMTMLANLAVDIDTVYPSHNALTMSPMLLPKMRNALVEVANGRVPDAINGSTAEHRFDGFGVLVPAEVQS